SFQNDKTTFRNEIDTAKEEFREEIEELKEGIDTDTSDLVSKLETKLQEAERLVNIIGNVGVTGNYQNIANSHKSSADYWRVMAVIFMSIFSLLLVWTYLYLSSDMFVWINIELSFIVS